MNPLEFKSQTPQTVREIQQQDLENILKQQKQLDSQQNKDSIQSSGPQKTNDLTPESYEKIDSVRVLPTGAKILAEEDQDDNTTNTTTTTDQLIPIPDNPQLPNVLIIIGMAGSGKTTFVQRLKAHSKEKKIPNYVINLDPAVVQLPYKANIDIRDTIKYQGVMEHYNLGPNGGILTSLNLYSTKLKGILDLVEKRYKKKHTKNVFIDTPGQIEVFTWSASGTIMTQSFSLEYPTTIVYVIDTVRCASPVTFMSNMLYAVSILYKTQLPFLIVFNKTDVVDHQFAVEWLTDYDSLLEALQNDKSYLSSFSRSAALVLEKFYKHIRCVGLSAVTGHGLNEFFHTVQLCRNDYWSTYRPMIELRIQKNRSREQLEKHKALKKISTDIDNDYPASRTQPKSSLQVAKGVQVKGYNKPKFIDHNSTSFQSSKYPKSSNSDEVVTTESSEILDEPPLIQSHGTGTQSKSTRPAPQTDFPSAKTQGKQSLFMKRNSSSSSKASPINVIKGAPPKIT